MQVLVTGGNGFVGRHLVPALLQRGDRVSVLALPTEDASWLEARGAQIHRGDVCRPETLVEPMRGAHGVIHLAAMQDVWCSIEQYRAVNVLGTANVCAAAHTAGVRRVVHMSSSSVYGMNRRRLVDESTPLAPFHDPYPITKAEADMLVQRLIAEEGLPAVVLRPDQIFGPGDHVHFGHMADRLRDGRGVVVGSGRNVMPFVYVADAVQGLLLALDHERAVGHAFNITNDARLTQQELLDAIAREIGAKPPRLHLPFRALYAAGWAAEQLVGLTRRQRRPPITRFGVAFFGTDNRHAIDKARRELGFNPSVSLREGVRRAAAWYLRLGAARQEAAAPSPVRPAAERAP